MAHVNIMQEFEVTRTLTSTFAFREDSPSFQSFLTSIGFEKETEIITDEIVRNYIEMEVDLEFDFEGDSDELEIDSYECT